MTTSIRRRAAEPPAPVRARGFVLAVVVALGFACGAYTFSVLRDPALPAAPGVLWPEGRALTPFSLSDHGGGEFNLESLRGRWTLLSFGYTSCPDVCPMTLSAMRGALERLDASGADAAPAQGVFVSVDPGRDTRERLAAWVTHFGPHIVGVRGEDNALHGLTTQLGVVFWANAPGDGGHYTVDHTASVMLIDPRARLVAVLAHPHASGELARRVAAIRDGD